MSLDRDQSILTQVAFKGGVELASALVAHDVGAYAEETATSLVVRLAEEFKAYLFEVHGYTDRGQAPPSSVGSESLLDEALIAAFPGTTDESLKDVRVVEQQAFNVEIKNKVANGPLPADFLKTAEELGKHYWYDNRHEVEGTKKPHFKSADSDGKGWWPKTGARAR